MKFSPSHAPGTLLIFLALGSFTAASYSAERDAQAIVARSLQAFYYAGDDLQAQVSMRLITAQGMERKREMTMLRKNLAGEQRYYIYFHAPADVKGTSFMVWKYPQQDDDRWIFIPAINLVRRIAANDKRSSFVGSDFTYEDVSGRDVGDETHVLLREEEVNGRGAYIVESRPKVKVDYARRVAWIDRERWLPLQEEYFDARGEKMRVFTAERVEQISGYWTVTARTMKNTQTGHRTEVRLDRVRYNVGLEQDLFSERYLRNPPQRWLR